MRSITTADDIKVSFLVGQITLDNSCFTCLINNAGDVFLFSNLKIPSLIVN